MNGILVIWNDGKRRKCGALLVSEMVKVETETVKNPIYFFPLFFINNVNLSFLFGCDGVCSTKEGRKQIHKFQVPVT